MIEYFGTIPDDLKLNVFNELSDITLVGEVHETIDSTNTRLRQLLQEELQSDVKARLPYGLLKMVCADQQTSGKGRLQRAWWSPAGQNTYTSFAIHFPGHLDLSGLSLAVGLGLRRVLVQQTGLDIFLKWPNDVLTPQGKLAGILIEALHQQDSWLIIIGIGTNVNMQPQQGQPQQPWTSLAQELGRPLSRGPIILDLYQTLAQDMLKFLQFGWQGFSDEWKIVDLLEGSLVDVFPGGVLVSAGSGAEEVWQGTARGVDYQGRLLLEDCHGHVHAVISGDVSVRLSKSKSSNERESFN